MPDGESDDWKLERANRRSFVDLIYLVKTTSERKLAEVHLIVHVSDEKHKSEVISFMKKKLTK